MTPPGMTHKIVFILDLVMNYCRWVYKRIFVADGNFKADHVRQKNEAGDVWLSEGSGMIPRREEYMSFLATAIERLTVSPCHAGSGPVQHFNRVPVAMPVSSQ
jgi:hypothetical protein